METKIMNIALADDDADDRAFFAEALGDMKNVDVQLKTFENGAFLMDYLEDKTNELPHMLFLDLNMPGKSGKKCLEEIRANSRFNNVSVAIYSTSGSEKDIEDTLSGGANIYIQKPNDFHKLKAAIRHVLKLNWQFHLSGMSKETFFLKI
jgi:DNA-binding response OmpR family regulator